MLTPRENFLEYLKPDGKPEYLNNSFQMFRFLMGDPCSKFIRGGRVRGVDSVDPWGTFIHFGADEPAAIPIVTQENQVIPDLEHWEDYLKAPDLKANCAEGWEGVRAQKEAMDSERFLSAVVVPTGIFERLHMLMTFEDTLMGFLLEPEAMHGLIDAITDYKLTYLQLIVENVHPDAIISHDDWGTQTSLFFSKAVWEEFFKEPYRKLYGYLKENNVIVIHHSDSFLEPIAGEFESIGIDVWQGVIPSNNIVRLGQELKGSLGLMGGIDSIIDMEDWSQETIHAEVWRACDAYKDVPGYWPGMTYGGPGALFPGVYDAVAAEISRYNLEHFGVDPFL